jgi:PHS family inorganic phosphate transporter-like MFS transporter
VVSHLFARSSLVCHDQISLKSHWRGKVPFVVALAAEVGETPGQGQGRPSTLTAVLDEAPTTRFHRRAVIVSGVGFFTDAYDLFVISTVTTLLKSQWHLTTTQASWVSGSAILGAFFGALLFGRLADLLGRKRVYALVAVLMIVGALLSAVAPGFAWLVGARLLLGLGIGGDYPVSAVLMSEYSNRKDRGRLVGLVFSMQALGLIVGPIVAMALLGGGVSHGLTWRLLLAFGAIPAAAVVYLRSKMPESPRFQARVKGVSANVIDEVEQYSGGEIKASPSVQEQTTQLGLRSFLTDRRMLRLLIGTAGAWFLFDYAYYGNTLSLPAILKDVDPTASLMGKLALTLLLFVVFAVPGYLLAIVRMDRFGHRRLQILGFGVMALTFAALGLIGPLTEMVGPFIAIFGVSYFFVQFGPNTMTFVLPSEVFPTSVRATGHGFAAGVGKLGAFIGVFLVPQLQSGIGLRGLLLVAGAASVGGLLLTLLLPETNQRSLDDISGESPLPSSGDSVGSAQAKPLVVTQSQPQELETA